MSKPLLSPFLQCSCGSEFVSECVGIQSAPGEPPLGMANCPLCGSTRCWEVESGKETLGDALWKARRFAETFRRVVYVTDAKPHRFLSRRPKSGIVYEVRYGRS